MFKRSVKIQASWKPFQMFERFNALVWPWPLTWTWSKLRSRADYVSSDSPITWKSELWHYEKSKRKPIAKNSTDYSATRRQIWWKSINGVFLINRKYVVIFCKKTPQRRVFVHVLPVMGNFQIDLSLKYRICTYEDCNL